MEVRKAMNKLKYAVPSFAIPNSGSVAYWENFLAPEEINLLLAQPEWLNMQDGVINTGGQAPVTDETIRKTKVAWLDTKPELETIWGKFASVTAEVNAQFFHFDLDGFYEPMQICLYEEQTLGHYDWHTDVGPGMANRKISVVVQLSDPSDYTGGELNLNGGNGIITAPKEKNTVIIFPSFVLHRVTPVLTGIRKSLVTWVAGPPLR
jgi:PKHD-type hydroxylase